MSSLKLAISADPAALAAFCERWGVSELAAFGSVLTARFGPESDVDLLLTPRAGTIWSLLDQGQMRDELSALFGRPVDLLVRSAVEHSHNWIRRTEILSTAEPLYAAR